MNEIERRESVMLHRQPVSRRGSPVQLLTAAAIAAFAAGCLPRNDVTSSIPLDYRQRHAIALTQADHTLDVFVGANSGSLDRRQAEDVRAFGRDYMQNGRGPLVAYLPTDAHSAGVSHGLASIRSALAGGGASGRLQIAHYPSHGGGASPIKLAFVKLKAETATRCGYQDEDIVPSKLGANAANNQSYNFGCSYQKNFAAQIADPRDLVRPRQEGPIDVDKRLAGIERIRESEQSRLEPGGTTLKQTATQ